jgi:O-antigen/teichoic acid export membrane protein
MPVSSGPSLEKNAIYLTMSAFIVSGIGLLYWVIIARLYDLESVGQASGLISLFGIISTISMLGFNKSVVRLMPEIAKKDALVNSLFFLVLASSFSIALVCAIALPHLSADLAKALEPSQMRTVFVATSMIWSICVLIDFVFIARRAGRYVLGKNALFVSVRTAAVALFVAAGTTGILLSWFAAGVVTIILSLFLMHRVYGFRIRFNAFLSRDEFSKLLGFSSWNCISDILYSIPLTLSPLIVLAMVGSSAAAEFMIALAIYLVVASIGSAFSNSLLAEGANAREPKSIEHLANRALVGAMALTSMAFVALFLFGRQALGILSPDYAVGSYGILLALSLSAIPYSVFIMNATYLNVRKKVVSMTGLYGIYAFSSISAMIVLGNWYGNVGVAEGILAGQTIAAIVAMCTRYLSTDELESRR